MIEPLRETSAKKFQFLIISKGYPAEKEIIPCETGMQGICHFVNCIELQGIKLNI